MFTILKPADQTSWSMDLVRYQAGSDFQTNEIVQTLEFRGCGLVLGTTGGLSGLLPDGVKTLST